MGFKIDSISILDKADKATKLSLVDNLNIIIGLNGSGKSYLLECIGASFLLQDEIDPDDETNPLFFKNRTFERISITFSNDSDKVFCIGENTFTDCIIELNNEAYSIAEPNNLMYTDNGIVEVEEDGSIPYIDIEKYLPSKVFFFNNSKINPFVNFSRQNKSHFVLFNESVLNIAFLTLIHHYNNKGNEVNKYVKDFIESNKILLHPSLFKIQYNVNKQKKLKEIVKNFEKFFDAKEKGAKWFYEFELDNYLKKFTTDSKDVFEYHYCNYFSETFFIFELDFIKSLSEGQKNYALLLCMTQLLADENTLILLDEPDASIDYSKKIQLLRIAQNCVGQVVMTTHDPVLVSNIDSTKITMLENGHLSSNQSFARCLAQNIEGYNMLDALGIQGMPYLVISEGPSDEKIIKKAIEELGYEDYFRDVFFLNSGGTGNTKHFFENTLIKFRKNLIKKVLFIYDRDEAGYGGRNEINALKKKNFQFDSLFITPNDLDFYLYREYGKKESDYMNKPHSIDKKESFDYFYYLENYVDPCNYFYNGEVVQITMDGKVLTFNEMKKICPSSKDLKKYNDTNNPIIPNCKVKYGSTEENLTAITLKNVIEGIKSDVLNKPHKKEYFKNFIYLLNDILDALGLPKP